jgi:hypothetical protein
VTPQHIIDRAAEEPLPALRSIYVAVAAWRQKAEEIANEHRNWGGRNRKQFKCWKRECYAEEFETHMKRAILIAAHLHVANKHLTTAERPFWFVGF